MALAIHATRILSARPRERPASGREAAMMQHCCLGTLQLSRARHKHQALSLSRANFKEKSWCNLLVTSTSDSRAPCCTSSFNSSSWLAVPNALIRSTNGTCVSSSWVFRSCSSVRRTQLASMVPQPDWLPNCSSVPTCFVSLDRRADQGVGVTSGPGPTVMVFHRRQCPMHVLLLCCSMLQRNTLF